MGSLGEDIAQTVASRLGWELINREYLLNKIFAPVCSDNELFRLRESAKYFLNERKPGETYLDYMADQLIEIVGTLSSVVLVGFGSQILFGDSEDALHIRLMAPDENRLERIRREFNCQTQDAEKIMTTSDRKHKRFVSTVYGADLADLSLYDLTINTAGLSVDEVCGTIVALVREKQSRQKVASRSIETETINNLTEKPVFKNPAEIEFAKILDMYHIDWLYEPRTFPIEWDAEGNVIQAFSPDFYLTRFDTYIELTTMNQKYVTQKNRKARKVRELYPGTNIKIVYKKDFQSLIERFSSAGDS
jgi:cytidylate kinase